MDRQKNKYPSASVARLFESETKKDSLLRELRNCQKYALVQMAKHKGPWYECEICWIDDDTYDLWQRKLIKSTGTVKKGEESSSTSAGDHWFQISKRGLELVAYMKRVHYKVSAPGPEDQ